ncbi:MAG: S8 family serine peptidase [Blautia sp.]
MDLTDIIYSNDYINILIQNYVAQSERYQMLFPESSALLTLNPQYSVLFLERSLLPENLFGAVPFTGLPKLFTPLSTLSLEVSGIVQTQNLYGGGYTGKNVIFGFLDTGIDYRHPAFLHAATARAGFLPSGIRPTAQARRRRSFPMAVSTTSQISTRRFESRRSTLPVVPVTDPDGHGTYVAGVAGGTPNASAGFLGAAPEADFAVVKLKPAKQNLKDFYLVSTNAPVFEEDDLLSAMRFLNEVAASGRKTTGHLSGTRNESGQSFRHPSHRSDAWRATAIRRALFRSARPATKETQHTIIMALYPKLTPRKM